MLDYLIFYEVKPREMESIILLRNELTRRGYTCDYISFSEIYKISLRKKYFGKVRCAIVPSLYNNKEILHIIYRIAGKVDHIVNLRWEQVFNNETELNLDHYVFPKESAKNAIHCCWGPEPKRMIENCGVNSKHAVMTGPMHMDILSPTFSNYYINKDDLFSNYSIPRDRPAVLFISSFVLATYTEREIDAYLKEVGEENRREILDKLEFDRKSHKCILDWLLHISNKYSYNIIYRPHPAENRSKLVDTFGGDPHFFIISELNVKQWIKVCDVVLTWVSTSVVESFFFGVPCAILRPFEIPINRDMSIYRGAKFINSLHDLDDYLRKGNQIATSLSPDTVSKYYDYDKDRYSFLRVADLLCDLEKFDYFNWDALGVNYTLQKVNWIREYFIRGAYRLILRVLSNKIIMRRLSNKKLLGRIDNYHAIRSKEKSNTISLKEFDRCERILDDLYMKMILDNNSI